MLANITPSAGCGGILRVGALSDQEIETLIAAGLNDNVAVIADASGRITGATSLEEQADLIRKIRNNAG